MIKSNSLSVRKMQRQMKKKERPKKGWTSLMLILKFENTFMLPEHSLILHDREIL